MRSVVNDYVIITALS